MRGISSAALCAGLNRTSVTDSAAGLPAEAGGSNYQAGVARSDPRPPYSRPVRAARYAVSATGLVLLAGGEAADYGFPAWLRAALSAS